MSHYLSASDAADFVVLTNVIGNLLYRFHEPVRLSVASAVKIIPVQFIFATSELCWLHGGWFVTGSLLFPTLVLGLPAGRRRGLWFLVLLDHRMADSVGSIVALFTKC